jgi:aminotransferase
MYSRAELELVDRVAAEHDLLVITDEIYEYIRYEGRAHISPATVGGLRQRTVTIMGLSKTFSITGWRIGYAVAPEPLARAITLVNDLYYVCAPTPLQWGVASGFAAPMSYFDDLRALYSAKRELICTALHEAGMKPIVPQGAYYVLCDVEHWGCPTAKAAAMRLLNEAKVASVPGSAFYRGQTGERLLRFCFSAEHDQLEEACRRIRSFRA